MARGRFITLEGGEGAGKSTQVARLAEALRLRGLEVLTTREPGGTANAEAVRALLVTGAADRWDALGELFLLNAARRDHVRRVIAPALALGAWVISDRYVDSTRIYQGAVKGLADGLIMQQHHLATDGLMPDLTLVLDLDPVIGLARAAARAGGEGRFESEDHAFHQRLRAGFQALAAAEPERFRVIDASQDPDTVALSVIRATAHALPS
jgi:dTMP kinase